MAASSPGRAPPARAVSPGRRDLGLHYEILGGLPHDGVLVGRLGRLSWLRAQPYCRDVLVLCSQATPAHHLRHLREHRVEHVVAGVDHVDLAAALRVLADRCWPAAARCPP